MRRGIFSLSWAGGCLGRTRRHRDAQDVTKSRVSPVPSVWIEPRSHAKEAWALEEYLFVAILSCALL